MEISRHRVLQADSLLSMEVVSPRFKDACASPSSDVVVLLVEEGCSSSGVGVEVESQSRTEPHRACQWKTLSKSCLDWTKIKRIMPRKMTPQHCCFCLVLTTILLLLLLSAVGASFLTTSMVLSRARFSRRDKASGMLYPLFNQVL